MEGDHHRDRGLGRFGRGGFVAGQPIHRDNLHLPSERLGVGFEASTNAYFDLPSTTAKNLDEPVLVLVAVRAADDSADLVASSGV